MSNREILTQPAPALDPSVLPAPDLGTTLDNLWRIVWRRRWGCLGIMVAVSILGFAVLAAQRPLYTAHAVMVLTSREPDLAGTDQVSAVSRPPQIGAPDIESEIQLMTSRQALVQIVKTLHLENDWEFRGVRARERSISLHGAWEALLRGDWDGMRAALAARSEMPVATQEEAIAELLLRRLRVEPIGRSNTVDISFAAQDPTVAAKVANAIADAYVANRFTARREAAERALGFLKSRAGELQQDVAKAELAVEKFRTTSVLRDGRDIEQLRAEMEKINAQLATARIAKGTAVSKLEAVEERVRKNGLSAALETGEWAKLDDRLREMTAEAKAKLAANLADRGTGHPATQRAEKEYNALHEEVLAEARSRLTRLQSDVGMADQQIRLLEESLQKFRSDYDGLSGALLTLKGLEREASASRAVYESFLNRVKLTEQVGFNEAQTWSISRALPPLSPSSPNNLHFFIGTLVLALGAALSYALFGEYRAGQTVLGLQQILDHGLRPLGIMPAMSRRAAAPRRVLAACTDGSTSLFSEAVDSTFTSIAGLPRQGHACLVLLVTSSVPYEGKSTAAIALAARIAGAGRKVLLIDADLRSPQLHGAFGLPAEEGLSGFADPDFDPNGAIRIDRKTGMAVLGAGPQRPAPQNVLRSPRLAEAIDNWRSTYDYILIDSAPTLPVSDARILAPLTDYCLFVVRWHKTRWTAALHALRLLREAGGRVAGIVITNVDARQMSSYSFAEPDAYAYAYCQADERRRPTGLPWGRSRRAGGDSRPASAPPA